MARQGGGHNGHMVVQTSIATILEFPSGRPREPWVPRHARQPTVDDFEFYWLNPIQPLWNLTGRPPPRCGHPIATVHSERDDRLG